MAVWSVRVKRFWRRAFLWWIVTMALWMGGVNLWENRMGRSGMCEVSYVYDGDTVALNCGRAQETARVMGLDAPETKRPGCAMEKALGDRATARLRALVARGPVSYRSHGHDKYGRRLIRLMVGDRDVADVLVNEGLAVAYSGGSRPNWCERLGQ